MDLFPTAREAALVTVTHRPRTGIWLFPDASVGELVDAVIRCEEAGIAARKTGSREMPFGAEQVPYVLACTPLRFLEASRRFSCSSSGGWWCADLHGPLGPHGHPTPRDTLYAAASDNLEVPLRGRKGVVARAG